jgi:hypothetical protein
LPACCPLSERNDNGEQYLNQQEMPNLIAYEVTDASVQIRRIRLRRCHMASKDLFKSISNCVNELFENPPGAENSFSAVAKLLIMAVVRGTTAPVPLARETGYPLGFVLAIAWNMRLNGRWTHSGYDASVWLPSDGKINVTNFLDDVSAAAGELWFLEAAEDSTVPTSELYCQAAL